MQRANLWRWWWIVLIGIAYGQSAPDAIRIVQDELGFGARALAMGGAYSGAADDYSAIYWNPAGLAAIRKSSVVAELSHYNFANQATFRGNLTDESQNYTRVSSIGFAYPFQTYRGSFVMAFGYNRIKDFDQNLLFSGTNSQSNGLSFDFDGTIYDFDQNVYQLEQVSDEGGLNQWSLAAGVSLSPNFTAGATAMIWSGQSDYQFSFRQEDRQNLYNVLPGDFDSYTLSRNLLTDYSAIGLKLGGMFDLPSGLKLGVAVGLPVNFHIDETFTESDVLIFDDGFEDRIDGDPAVFEYEVTTPMHFDAGASINTDLLTLAGGIRYRDWSQTEFNINNDFLDDPDYVGLLQENSFIRQDYEATLQYNLGGELYLDGLDAMVRLGYAVFPSPLKDAPAEMDKKYLTGGIGFRIDRYVSLDLTFLRGSWEQESEDEFTPGGTLEEITTTKLLVGLTYSFK